MFGIFKRNTYVKNIVTLMSGTLAAQAIMLAFFPVLTRLYTPDEFGVYSIFIAITGILGMVSSLKYDQAIMLPKSDKDALTLACLSASLTIVTVAIVTIIVVLGDDYLLSKFDGRKYVVWLIPVGVLLTGLLQILNAYSSRHQKYRAVATVRVINALSITSVQAGSRYFYKLDGLIVGRLLGDVISAFLLIKLHIKHKTLQLKVLTLRRFRTNAKRHETFPKYQSLTVLLNSVSQNMPVLFFGVLYSAEIAGFYGLAVRVLQAPISLIGSSTREVFYQKASKMFAAGEDIFELYFKTTIGLVKIFVIPFFVVLIFGESLFYFIFGDEWRVAGKISQLLILWFFMGFIISPSIATFSILRLQDVQMKIEIVSLFFRVVSIFVGYYYFDSYIVSIVLFMVTSVADNIYSVCFIYYRLRSNPACV